MDSKVIILSVCLFVVQSTAFPNIATEKNSLIVKPLSDEVQQDTPDDKEGDVSKFAGPPKIYEMRVDSNITNRFAHTLITSKVKNPGNKAHEATFSVVLPKKAFISKFVMNVGGKDYEAYIEEKKQAKATYDQAVEAGQGAGLVSASARESNSFTVSVNIEPESKAIFYLTYEQLLERKDSRYELVVNIHPKQPVKDLTVYVNINESQPLLFVKAPPIRSGNEISKVEGDLDPRAQIFTLDDNSAVVKFSPNIERQKELAKTLGTDEKQGLSGQFIVEYDVRRNTNGGEILLHDGYFVHFFAPANVKPLPKYIIFVLDTSGSMSGTKINQLKVAMKSILSELNSQDKFHIIDFNYDAKVLDLYNPGATVKYPSKYPSFYGRDSDEPIEDIRKKNFAPSYTVNPDNIKKANKTVDMLDANGGTNIDDSLKVALYLIEVEKKNNPSGNGLQPMIIFLTDGDATVGETNSQKILSHVQEQNRYSIPIFSLSFGYGADKNLLQKLSLQNNGFSRHIYEAADATLQLQDFYKQISSPVLSNVTFKYVDETNELSKTVFPILFEGSEIVVVGRLGENKELSNLPKIKGYGINGYIDLVPEVKRPVSQLERLWAYLTIQQFLDDMERFDNKTAYEKKILNLALKYSFVTPVSSLVVVKPNTTNTAVEPLAADRKQTYQGLVLPLSISKGFSGYSPRFSSAPTTNMYSASNRLAFRHYAMPQRPMYSMYDLGSMGPGPDIRLHSMIRYDDITTTLPLTTTLSPIAKLKQNLPWLNDVLSGDVISTSKGSYKLGLNETSIENVQCPSSTNNVPGLCKLLHECPQVHDLLITVDIFQKYRCDMKEFAAICCPKNSSS